ncbi:MAG: HAD-IIIC family phosphatase [Steroidobacteraceae bacterium]|jgi:FkbH-like protein|nr:HAD-IIIC family phosphatase [Steroidobacteraceae bacterium]
MSDLFEELRTTDPLTLDRVDVRRVSRALRAADRRAEARIALAGSVIFEPLPEFIEANLACRGLVAACHATAFGQSMQELLDPDSALHRFDPNFLLLHSELDALAPDYAVQLDAGRGRACLTEILETIGALVRAALERTRATILLDNFPTPYSYELGLADWRAAFGEQEFFAELNLRLARTWRSEPRVQILDLQRLTSRHGLAQARDQRLYYMARMPWRESFLPLLADEIARHVGAGLGRIRKCLVVDLDNTLWAGVLGEDGPLGVRVGPGDPLGEAHHDLQRRIRAIRRRGVLLAACSKNNPAEVDEMFRVRSDMPLQRADFACMQIGWRMKHEGLRAIAETLNIGTDSLAFLDDNPAEIELVRQLMPEVECVLLPRDPASWPFCLERVHGLERAMVTDEDRAKTQQYQQNAARQSARTQFCDLRQYLRSLETRIVIRPVGRDLLARAHQLFTKTNQFNVTTQRYSAAEIEAFARDPSCSLLMVHAQDRFGELGWIGAVLLRGLGGPAVHIDSFVLSCRALGRGVESAVLHHVSSLCFGRTECQEITAQFRPTARNAPVLDLYDRHGFTPVDESAEGVKRYRLVRGASAPAPCDWIAVRVETCASPEPTEATPSV